MWVSHQRRRGRAEGFPYIWVWLAGHISRLSLIQHDVKTTICETTGNTLTINSKYQDSFKIIDVLRFIIKQTKQKIHALYISIYFPLPLKKVKISVFIPLHFCHLFPILLVQQKSFSRVLWLSVSLGPYDTGC